MKTQRKQSLALIIVIVVAVAAISSVKFLLISETPREQPLVFPLVHHEVIQIGGDRDFTLVGTGFGCECVRSGVGTEKDPYLITRWTINASGVDGISILGTKAYFLIEEVRIFGSSMNVGIKLLNAEAGKITNTLIANMSDGVYVYRSTGILLRNNTLADDEFGIRIESSDNNTLISNHLDGTQVAIFVRGSDNLVKDNVIMNSKFGGINIDGTAGSANRNVIENNTVIGSKSYGIAMWRATSCLLKDNTVGHNGVGMLLTGESARNTIEGNIVTQNVGDGILLAGGSVDNIITKNIAKGNGNGVTSFDLHEQGLKNIWQDNAYDTKNPDTLG